MEARTASGSDGGRVTKKHLSAEQARAILREYPDADLSAFDVEGDPDQMAAEEAEKSLASIGEKLARQNCNHRFEVPTLFVFCNREAGHAGPHSYTPPEAPDGSYEHTLFEDKR